MSQAPQGTRSSCPAREGIGLKAAPPVFRRRRSQPVGAWDWLSGFLVLKPPGGSVTVEDAERDCRLLYEYVGATRAIAEDPMSFPRAATFWKKRGTQLLFRIAANA